MCEKDTTYALCTFHAAQVLNEAKTLLAQAVSDDEVHSATLSLVAAQSQFNATNGGIKTLERVRARTPEKRDTLTEILLASAETHAKQKVAMAHHEPGSDIIDLAEVSVNQQQNYIDDEGNHRIRITTNDELLEILNAKTSKEMLDQASLAHNQKFATRLPIGTKTSFDKKVPTWQDAEDVNAMRVEQMLLDGFHIVRAGSSDSTVSDIAIFHDATNTVLTYVESKMNKAQSGQIVVKLDNNGQWLPTKATNFYDVAVVNIMNKAVATGNPDAYLSQLSPSEQDVVVSWFKEHYTKKNAHFVAVTDKNTDYTAVFALDDVERYANITIQKPRAKASGSSSVPTKEVDAAKEAAKDHFKDALYSFEQEGKRLFANFLVAQPKGSYFGDGYVLSSTATERINAHGQREFKYEIRKTSATRNATIMFNFEYIGDLKTHGTRLVRDWCRSIVREHEKLQE